MGKTGLVEVSAIEKALAKAKTLPDVLDIRNRGHSAVQHAARARLANLDQLNDAMVGVLLAERRLGRMLLTMLQHGGDRRSDSRSHDATLKKLDITKSQSSRWQAEGRVKDKDFWVWVEEKKTAKARLTSTELARLGRDDEDQPTETGIVTNLRELIDTGQKFACIYADPPWPYDNRGTRAAASKHYPTMTLEDITAEPVAELAAENAHLHLWTTNAFLPHSFAILDAWGFEYKSVLIWTKPQLGMGNYWRVSHEFVLLGTRGRCPFRQTKYSSVIKAKRTRHSRKPRIVREQIEQVSPGPYLELYGTEQVEGWVVYGNRVERNLFSNGKTKSKR